MRIVFLFSLGTIALLGAHFAGAAVPNSLVLNEMNAVSNGNFLDQNRTNGSPRNRGDIGLIPGGAPVERLVRWLDGMETACLTAMRHLDDIEAWSARAQATTGVLSGKTPPALCRVLTEWPLVSAPMAEQLTGASRAAVQRNLAWMEAQGLIREVTGQGRFRMWKAA